MTYQGKWYGKDVYFGLHYDLHANEKDTALGTHCTVEELVPALGLMDPDFVQTDCKGHAGMTSWFSQVPSATVSPGVVKDALMGWRKATRAMGIPLHCHYSGIWDRAASAKFPDWVAVPNPREAAGEGKAFSPRGGTMCPRGPYLEKLLLPQFMDLIDRYEVDGFWVDGEIWAVEPCYCDACRAALKERTGIAEPPVSTDDPNWVAWINFTRENFQEYVTKYCDAVHEHKPGVLVCSNWLQTFKDPGEPTVPTDWISGDTATVGIDRLRCEARFISTRGKPWDIMSWAFYKTGDFLDATIPWVIKPVQMLEQEAATILALGGNYQIYERPQKVRDGRLAPWRMKRLGEVGKYVRQRKALCQGTETIPQAVVLHSETHYRNQPSRNLREDYDASYVEGAVFSLLDNSYGVDILDEWALMPRLRDFALVVVPEEENISEEMVGALVGYVREGGRLLLTGAGLYERFGAQFIGAESSATEGQGSYYLPAADGAFPLYSREWRFLKPTTAQAVAFPGRNVLLDADLLAHPLVTLNNVGRGKVAYVGCDLFSFFQASRYPLLRCFVGELVEALEPRLPIEVHAPAIVDVILRQRAGRKIIHFINRTLPLANYARNGPGDDIPAVGPITVKIELPKRPRQAALAFEGGEGPLDYQWTASGGEGGTISVTIPLVRIHAALVVE